MEAGDTLRACAREHGFDERTVIFPVDDQDWAQFREAADSLSLFAERRIIELRLPTGKPGRTGSEVLKQYCEHPPEDVLLIISSGKLQADEDALALIAERVEGNMLAAVQEVERLALLYDTGTLTRENVLDAVADSARYSIGDLSLAALQGQGARSLRVLAGLRDESVAEVLILWSLSSEIRAGARTSEAIEAGVPADKALKSAGVWQSRIPPLKQAVNRHDAKSWLSMLSQCSTIDRQIKGQAPGAVWDAFESLVVQLANRGEPVMAKNPAIP